MDNTAVVVGAGFSTAAGLPSTAELLDGFIDATIDDGSIGVLRPEISAHLQAFWRAVFGWNATKRPPTFEDHFTAIDLAANTGHQLGAFYTPARLRAIRRLSLHRVFETLDKRFSLNADILKLIVALTGGANNSVVSTNWDIVVERHCREANKRFNYGVPMEQIGGGVVGSSGLRVLKLHGSSNWCYCDTCRRLFAYSTMDGKGTLKDWVFLEQRDFEALQDAKATNELSLYRDLVVNEPKCTHCGVRLSTRVATFSFDKALGFYQFHGVWEEALRQLRSANRWIFIGYSLPEADFELRHLLKTAQLAGQANRKLEIEVVLREDLGPRERFERFFGSRLSAVFTQGFEAWAASLPT